MLFLDFPRIAGSIGGQVTYWVIPEIFFMPPLARSAYLELLREEIGDRLWPLMLLSAFSGIASGVIVTLITSITETDIHGWAMLRFLLLFVMVALASLELSRQALLRVNREIERLVHRIRTRVADRIRHAELRDLERLDLARIYVTTAESTENLTKASMPVFKSIGALVLIAYCLVQIGLTSTVALALVLGSFLGASLLYLYIEKYAYEYIREAYVAEYRFFKLMRELARGFKELRLNRARDADIHADLESQADRVEARKMRAHRLVAWLYSYTDLFFFLTLGLLIFLLPLLHAWTSRQLADLIAILLFLGGGVAQVVLSVHQIAQANVAVQQLREMETGLRQCVVPDTPQGARPLRELTLKKAVFSHRDEEGGELYTVGPVSLTIRPGEVYFLVGGNGSGKSTLLKIIAGLYAPEDGEILLNGEAVVRENRQDYRELVSAVFTDFHLFDRLLGWEETSPERVNALLEELGLASKVSFENGGFSTLQLSTGQRKRLALAVALLEDRPLLLLDEVAADQDPYWREEFYTRIVPKLKARGKAVVVIGHHDRYFETGDMLWRMDYGELVEQRPARSTEA